MDLNLCSHRKKLYFTIKSCHWKIKKKHGSHVSNDLLLELNWPGCIVKNSFLNYLKIVLNLPYGINIRKYHFILA